MKNILFAIVALALVAACSKEPEPAKLVIDLAAGQAIAEADCSGCHGMDGRGDTSKIPNLAAQPAEYLVNAMHAYRDGQRHHAALQDLTSGMSEADILNIAGYYASQPVLKPLIETVAATIYSEGETFAAVCEECHGERGISTTEGTPNLAGQQPVYLIVAMQEYKNGSRGHEGKDQMLSELEQVDIEKMAMYFASQVPAVRAAPPFGDPVAGEPLSAECGECHGARGVSNEPLVPSLAGQEPNYLVAAISAYRSQERSHEDMVTDISDEVIADIAAFYTVQQAGTAGEIQSTAQELAAKCDRCHSPVSGERKLNVPSLRGQSHDYLIKAMKEYRREGRDNSMMHKMSSRYSDEMIEDLATYYAAQ